MAQSAPARATSADVARLANVSRATVSYVLNSTPDQKISERTRVAVLNAAEQLGYRPNIAAKSLAAGESALVVFVMPSVHLGEFALGIGSSLTKELAGRGVALAVHLEADAETLLDLCHDLRPRAVISIFPLADEVQSALAEREIPTYSTLDGDSVAFREMNESGAAEQISYLAAKGHRSVAFARPDMVGLGGFVDQRVAAAAAACERQGLDSMRVETIASDGGNAAAVVNRWKHDGVTAVCAYNDEVAFAVLYGIAQAGLRCPEDLAVIGLDGISLGAVALPPLTTVAVSQARAAHFYATLLLGILGLDSASEVPESVFTVIPRVSA